MAIHFSLFSYCSKEHKYYKLVNTLFNADMGFKYYRKLIDKACSSNRVGKEVVLRKQFTGSNFIQLVDNDCDNAYNICKQLKNKADRICNRELLSSVIRDV